MQQFNQWMGDGHALCLLNKPNQIPDFGSCGNGIVDDGEACDCGGKENCERIDPCCDPVTVTSQDYYWASMFLSRLVFLLNVYRLT